MSDWRTWVCLVYVAGFVVYLCGFHRVTIGPKADWVEGFWNALFWPAFVPCQVVFAIWKTLCWLTRLRITVKDPDHA